jgi:hypothetical protein
MTNLKLTVGLAALLAMGGYAFAQDAPVATQEAPAAAGAQLSQADCLAVWSKADAAGKGSLDATQAQAYVTDFTAADENGDGALSQIEFQNGCSKGLVADSAMSGAGAGAEGTEDIPSESPAVPPQE